MNTMKSIPPGRLPCRSRNSVIFAAAFWLSALLAGCHPVKPFQRAYLNDPEMQMGVRKVQAFGDYVHAIREGATPAGGKASGGCGCN
jgi:hypothetical protein